MSESLGQAVLTLDANTAPLESKLTGAEKKALSDFSSISSSAKGEMAKVEAAMQGVPDLSVEGDFSGLERGSSVISGVEGDIKGIPDAQVDGDFSGLEGGADDAVDDVGFKLDSLKGMAKGGAAAAGAAGAAALGYAFSEALSLEASEDKLAAELGLSGKQAERAGRIAGELWTGAYGESIEEVQDAFASVFRDIGDMSEKAMKKATAYTLDLVQSFGADSGEITRTVGALIKNGLAKDTDEAFDLITVGFQKGADKGGEFLDTLNEYAQPVKDLGLSAKDFTNILIGGTEKGVWSVDKLGDAIKEFQIRAVDGTGGTNAAFMELGFDAEDMGQKFAAGGESAKGAFSDTLEALAGLKDPMQQERLGVQMFGAMWEDLGAKVILGMDPAVDRLGKVDGAAKNLDKTLADNLMTRFETFKRKAMLELIRVLMDGVIPAIEKGIDWVDSLGVAWDDVTKVIGPGIGLIKGYVSGLAQTLGGVIKVISGILHGDFSQAWEGVKQIFSAGGDKIIDILKGITAPARAIAKLIGKGIMEGISFVSEIPGKLAGYFGKGLDRVTSFAGRFAAKALSLGKNIVKGIGEGLSDFVSKIADFMGRGADRVVSFVDSFLSKATSLGKNIVKGIGDGLVDLVSKIGGLIGKGLDKVSSFAGDFLSAAKDLGGKIVSGIGNALADVGSTIADAMKKAIGAVSTFAGSVGRSIADWINDNTPLGDDISIDLGVKTLKFKLPALATGVENFAGGWAMVGERGPELVNLPQGSDVFTAANTRSMLGGGGSAGDMYFDLYLGNEKLDEHLVAVKRRDDRAVARTAVRRTPTTI